MRAYNRYTVLKTSQVSNTTAQPGAAANHLFACVPTATMTSVRNSTYSMHSVADAHLLAMLDGKQDECGLATQVSRLSAFFPTKLLETILIVPGTSRCKDETDMSGNRLSATSFDDMQRSIQVIGLPKPERSKSRLKLSSESERIIEDAADDDLFQDQDYDPEPQMQYLAPDKGVVAFTPKHRQQGCGYRHPPYSGPCVRTNCCGYGGGYRAPQRPPPAYFPGCRRQRRCGGGYYNGTGGYGYGRGGHPGCGVLYAQRPILIRRHRGCCCC
ncbi:hypothetical protein AUEXF2481DRAFT_467938 [Aureobasidium subglaciale EXF-2481]|uniref:Uncharacterized protein n=1 Tax=Aureobasidium subglaciale (strain EXF-2481) TaxID=1043005 RepID=A0A074Y6A4_AURSE|nr:uncharacterized protein AUEXF2481DRAFT_467938 [Aureobasidium subglaciale EXF-2481]KEQ91489.1 hypothetical protein AUEXF2481DRAFT_467938 [Aureobasidium subglaciale EXF-2481]